MKVYHGSYTEIETIDLSKGELQRDFGRGFYVTKLREQDEFWAKRKSNLKKTKGIVTEFMVFTAFIFCIENVGRKIRNSKSEILKGICV